MRILTLLTVCAILLTACGETIQGSGNVTSEKREISEFHSIDVAGFFDIELIEGNPKLEISTDDNLHEHIKTEVKDGSLKIYTENVNLDAEELKIKVYFRDLNSMSIAGAAAVNSTSTIKGERFDFSVAGAADANLDVKVTHLNIDLAGGSDMELKGKAEMVDIEIAGAGKVDAVKLKTQQCSVEISGAGEVDVNVDKKLAVDITGAGTVRYKGNPEDIKKTITGAGELTQL